MKVFVTSYSISLAMEEGFEKDTEFGDRLLISKNADTRELKSNVRAAKAILNSYPDTYIIINAHSYIIGKKNPEYTIDGFLGDRKGILTEKGITAGFKSAKKQGCKIVVIDLDEHVAMLRPYELSKYISRRKADFDNEMIYSCYIVFNGEAVAVNASEQSRKSIESVLETLKP